MILDKRKIKHGSQEEIGYELGLVVPKEKSHLFKKVRTGKKPASGWGTQVNKQQFSINHFFRKNKIKLSETYFPLIKIINCKKFIENNLDNANDIIACFNYKKLYNKGGSVGHVSLIIKIQGERITLLDPAKLHPKLRKVSLKKLISSMKFHGQKRNAGFWVISDFTS
jgi:hypothetical protein